MGKVRLLIDSVKARNVARKLGLCGLPYDSYGRRLALREMSASRRLTPGAFNYFVAPVSSVRYFEFDFVGNMLSAAASKKNRDASVLDVSSPRLFPFWVAEKLGLRVTMINPDREDIAETRRICPQVKGCENIEILDEIDATKLPFEENTFDFVTSISVIEHINDDGDSRMIDELVRVTRSSGTIFLTFPVKPEFENEFRDVQHYETQEIVPRTQKYFFQRYYDRNSIRERLTSRPGIIEQARQYYVEDPPGWFEKYEQEWIKRGLSHTVLDSKLMAEHFRVAGNKHPTDRLGVCGIVLTVGKRQ
jgi:SAM-dependent methyltransferase